jgi:hypothetical protein
MPFKNGTLDYALKLPFALEKFGLEVGPSVYGSSVDVGCWFGHKMLHKNELRSG